MTFKKAETSAIQYNGLNVMDTSRCNFASRKVLNRSLIPMQSLGNIKQPLLQVRPRIPDIFEAKANQ